MSETPSLSRIAYILTLIGGILLVILGLISLVGFFDFGGPFLRWGWGYGYFAYSGIIAIICGIIALIGAKLVATLVWAIVLIVVGIIGGGIGGMLVILGGIIGLVVVLSKKA